MKPSYEGATIYVDRDGLTYSIPNPETLTDDQRDAFIFDMLSTILPG